MVLGGLGLRVPKGLDHLADLPPPPPTPEMRCKILVSNYHTCAIIRREKGGKDSSWCQDVLRDLETHCAQFKSSWSDWWSTELKERFCKRQLGSYNYCVNKSQRGASWCEVMLEEFKAAGCK